MTSAPDRIVSFVRGFRTPSALITLAANLVPAACVFLFGWSAGILILLYWIETIVIGLFHALKLLVTGLAQGRSGLYVSVFLTPFFIVHYGLFCLGHGVFALLYLTVERAGGWTAGGFETLAADTPAFLLAQDGFVISLGVMVALQAIDFGRWLLARGWRGADGRALMVEPYGRIITLHVTLLATAFVMAALGSPKLGAVLLAIFKTLFEGAMAGRKAKADKASTVSQTAS